MSSMGERHEEAILQLSFAQAKINVPKAISKETQILINDVSEQVKSQNITQPLKFKQLYQKILPYSDKELQIKILQNLQPQNWSPISTWQAKTLFSLGRPDLIENVYNQLTIDRTFKYMDSPSSTISDLKIYFYSLLLQSKIQKAYEFVLNHKARLKYEYVMITNDQGVFNEAFSEITESDYDSPIVKLEMLLWNIRKNSSALELDTQFEMLKRLEDISETWQWRYYMVYTIIYIKQGRYRTALEYFQKIKLTMWDVDLKVHLRVQYVVDLGKIIDAEIWRVDKFNFMIVWQKLLETNKEKEEVEAGTKGLKISFSQIAPTKRLRGKQGSMDANQMSQKLLSKKSVRITRKQGFQTLREPDSRGKSYEKSMVKKYWADRFKISKHSQQNSEDLMQRLRAQNPNLKQQLKPKVPQQKRSLQPFQNQNQPQQKPSESLAPQHRPTLPQKQRRLKSQTKPQNSSKIEAFQLLQHNSSLKSLYIELNSKVKTLKTKTTHIHSTQDLHSRLFCKRSNSKKSLQSKKPANKSKIVKNEIKKRYLGSHKIESNVYFTEEQQDNVQSNQTIFQTEPELGESDYQSYTVEDLITQPKFEQQYDDNKIMNIQLEDSIQDSQEQVEVQESQMEFEEYTALATLQNTHHYLLQQVQNSNTQETFLQKTFKQTNNNNSSIYFQREVEFLTNASQSTHFYTQISFNPENTSILIEDFSKKYQFLADTEQLDKPQQTDLIKKITEIVIDLQNQRKVMLGLGPWCISRNSEGLILSDYSLCFQIEEQLDTEWEGDVEYVPPEVLEKGIVGEEAGYWTLGILLYYILYKKTPWADFDSLEEKKQEIMRGNVPFPEVPSDAACGDDLLSLIKQLCTLNPEERLKKETIFSHQFFSETETQENDMKESDENDMKESDENDNVNQAEVHT